MNNADRYVNLLHKSFWFTSLATPAQRWSFQPQQDVGLDVPESRPLIVAHRGASGMFPEHTSIAYEKAVEQAKSSYR